MVSVPGGHAIGAAPPALPVSLSPILLVVLVDVFGMTLVLPLLTVYAETLDASPLQATLLVSTFAVCQLLAAPVLGHWSDRIGRKPMLLLSQIGTLVGFVMLARAGSLWVVYLSRALDGATAGNIALAQAYIADRTTAETRTRALGLIGVAFGLGLFIGPSVTGVLSSLYGFTAPIWLAVALSATSILCTWFLLPTDDKAPAVAGRPSGRRSAPAAPAWRSYLDAFARPGLRELFVQFAFYALAFSVFLSGFALFAERRYAWNGQPFGPREIGFVFGYVGLVSLVVQTLLLGRLVRRFGERSLVSFGLASLAAGFVLFAVSPSLFALPLGATCLAAANAVLRPAITSLITQQATGGEQGLLAGMTAQFVSVASIVSPLVGGLWLEQSHLGAWALTGGVLAALGALSAVRVRRLQPAPSPAI